MKRFTMISALFGLGILAVWGIFQASPVLWSKAKSEHMTVQVSGVTGDALKAIHADDQAIRVAGMNSKISPRFDSTGAVISDPTGTLSGDVSIPVTGRDQTVAPLFDSTGAVVSDPSGTILNHP